MTDEKHEKSNASKDEVDDTVKAESVDTKQHPSMSPEYKSSWNDANIQGDYDQYARSTAPSRVTENNNTPPKKENYSSPRSKESDYSNDGLSPRRKRTRVKLTKPTGQSPRVDCPPAVAQIVYGENSERSVRQGESPSKTIQSESTKSKNVASKQANSNETAQPPNEEKNEKERQVNPKENNDSSPSGRNERETRLNKFSSSTQETTKDSNENNILTSSGVNDEKKLPSVVHRSKISNKSGQEFTPPIVTAVDFREPAFDERIKFATRNGLLVEGTDLGRPQDGNTSRMSTLFMANYLGVGYEPSPNMITSIVVKPILPPLNPKKTVIRRRRNNKTQEEEPTKSPLERKQNVSHGSLSNDARQLGPLKDEHLYRWKHNPVSSKLNEEIEQRYDAKRTPYRLLPREGKVESIFDHIVRWRSKVRHCGKPAMYRRITSPTLGEVALRRKLTDRLPTRQIRKTKPDATDLQPRSSIENWRRPRSRITAKPSVKQFIKQKLRDAQQDGSLTSPDVMDGFYNVTMTMKQHPIKHGLAGVTGNDKIIELPLPELSLRKRQPIWQRMR